MASSHTPGPTKRSEADALVTVSPYATAGATVTRPNPCGSRYLSYRWNSPDRSPS